MGTKHCKPSLSWNCGASGMRIIAHERHLDAPVAASHYLLAGAVLRTLMFDSVQCVSCCPTWTENMIAQSQQCMPSLQIVPVYDLMASSQIRAAPPCACAPHAPVVAVRH